MLKLIIEKENDPGAYACFEIKALKPHDRGKKRTGRPKFNWVAETQDELWEYLKQNTPEARYEGQLNLDNEGHKEWILQEAQRLLTEINRKAQHPEDPWEHEPAMWHLMEQQEELSILDED